jgi:hypothetical protein
VHKIRLNWLKILGNAGVAFFSVLAGTLTVNALCSGKIPLGTLLLAALISASIQAGLVFFKELARAAERKNGGPGAAGGTGLARPGCHTPKDTTGRVEAPSESRRQVQKCMRLKATVAVLSLVTVF